MAYGIRIDRIRRPPLYTTRRIVLHTLAQYGVSVQSHGISRMIEACKAIESGELAYHDEDFSWPELADFLWNC